MLLYLLLNKYQRLSRDIQDCDKKEQSEFLIVVCLDAVLRETVVWIFHISESFFEC